MFDRAQRIGPRPTSPGRKRARDKRRGTETGRLEWANSLYNRTEAERALRTWAVQLRNSLDAVRAAP